MKRTPRHVKHKKRNIIRAERIFMGMPVRDAAADILVQPTKGDIAKGVKGDPEQCAYAQCVKRMLNARVVFVYHTVAYAEALTEKGDSVLLRYTIKDGTKQYLETYDSGQDVKPAGFSLRAPNYSMTLDYKAALRKDQKRRGLTERWQKTREEKLRQEKQTGRKLIRRRVVANRTVGSFRDGTGCVRFMGVHDGMLAKHEFAEGNGSHE
jgi:hypothetical protein